jgi:hypothetical protein
VAASVVSIEHVRGSAVMISRIFITRLLAAFHHQMDR